MDIKNRILKSSFDLFLKHGLRRVSVDDICAEIRISKKTFYTCFKQKEELIATIVELMRAKHLAGKVYPEGFNAIDMILSDYSGHKKTQFERNVNFFFDLQKYYPVIHADHIAQMQGIAISHSQELLEKGIKEGLFREGINPEALSFIISRHHFTQIFSDLQENLHMSIKESLELVYDSFIHMVANEKGLSYYKELKTKQ